jgi:protein-S-isoprenylcysteine O-methyltransferase Ste14
VDLRKRSVQNWIFLVPLLGLIASRLATVGLANGRLPGFNHPLISTVLDGVGLLLLVLGLVVRVLARGWKAENSGGRLVTSGLYAIIRHPLYVASFLIGLGLCLILGDPIVLAVYLVLFLLTHGLVIRGEEEWMAGHWGEEYRRYASRVPRFVPRLAALRRRRRICPDRLTVAIGKEADAICAWLAMAFGLLGWKSLAEGVQPIAVVPLALAACCLILWPSLKRAARR